MFQIHLKLANSQLLVKNPAPAASGELKQRLINSVLFVNIVIKMKITNIQKKQLNRTGKKYHLELMLIFGSQANGKIHKSSDIDIGISRVDDLNLDQYSDLLSDLCKIFNVREDQIDIAEFKKASSLLLKEAAACGTVLYQKTPQSFIEFYLMAYKRYIDEKIIFESEKDYLTDRYLAKGNYVK